jgi:hypothetical protein
MLSREDIPPMDYIVLHGIWSWVSSENRKAIIDTIRKRLRVGGAVYFSYNTFPGWATAMPLRHIMSIHAQTAGTDIQGMVSRIDAAIAFGNKLSEVGARYFQANPLAKGRLDAIAGQNRNYLAHEYFNEIWTPMYFSEVDEWLSEGKLSYACPAGALDQMDGFNLTPAQRELIGGYPPGVLRETVRDYLLNQQFRRDLYTRGARRLSPLDRVERLNDVRIALTVPAADIGYEVDSQLGKVQLKKDVYEPIVEVLAANDAAPKRLGDMADDPKLAALAPGALIEGLAVLIGSGRAHPAQSEEDIAAVSPNCARLNGFLIERSRIAGDITWLASPVIGAGVAVGRFEQMFLGARAKGLKTPKDWAKNAWDTLAKQNQSIIKNGEMLKTAEANLEELNIQAKALADGRLALLQRLQVTP